MFAASLDAVSYRNAMRHHAGAVAIVSTGKAGSRTGLTVTAACSLSDDPPSVIVCVNRSASAYRVIRAERAFCINLLAEDQQEIAACFAGRTGLKGEARFAFGEWSTLATGVPALDGAVANFDCQLFNDFEMKTHSIFVGHVKAVRARDGANPLLYLRGDYGRVDQIGVPSDLPISAEPASA